jgi:hypothetical protein
MNLTAAFHGVTSGYHRAVPMLLLLFPFFCYVGSILLDFEKCFMGSKVYFLWYYFCPAQSKCLIMMYISVSQS